MIFDPIFLIIVIGFAAIGGLVQSRLKKKFKKYSDSPLREHITGRQIAEKMLQEHGIHDVKVISTPGKLTDHYNPANKTINLSESVYNSSNVAAAAVAAHETGHAVQHAESYSFLSLRSAFVPIVSFSSNMMQYVFLIGLFGAMAGFLKWDWILMLAIGAQGIMALFSVITLPVEFDASSRALKWMERSYVANSVSQGEAKDALNWAAMTYIVAALAAVAQLLYYVFMLLGRDD